MADVFISYSRADGDFVRELHDFLTGRGPRRLGRLGGHPARRRSGSRTSTTRSTRPRASSSSSAASSLASQYCGDRARSTPGARQADRPDRARRRGPGAAPPATAQLNWIWCRARATSAPQRSRLLDTRSTPTSNGRERTRGCSSARSSGTSGATRACSCAAATSRRRAELVAQRRQGPAPDGAAAAVRAREPAAPRRGGSASLLGSVTLALVVSIGARPSSRCCSATTANDRARVARSQALAAQAVDGARRPLRPTALGRRRPRRGDEETDEARVALRRAIVANPVV